MVDTNFQTGPSTGVPKSDTGPFGDTSVYYMAFAQDAQRFALTAKAYFNGLRNSNEIQKNVKSNDLEYLQGAVRALGLSKGVTPIGQLDSSDYDAISKVFKESYQNQMSWSATLDGYAQSPYTKLGGSGFSKSVSTALKLVDTTDAESILGKAVYETYGYYPSAKQIQSFKSKYNTEAQKQLAKTTTTTTPGADGVTVSKSVTTGEGFTQAESDQFIASYLKNNYKITGKEESGQAKTIIDNISRAYKDNLLPEPPLSEIIDFAYTLVGTGDAEIKQQKLDKKIQSIRNASAKFNPGITDILAGGVDAKTVTDPIVKSVNSYLGLNVDANNAYVKKIMNFNDGKTTRVMNSDEIQTFLESVPEFQVSDAGRAKYSNIAQALENGLR
jgi:hypothetical protein